MQHPILQCFVLLITILFPNIVMKRVEILLDGNGLRWEWKYCWMEMVLDENWNTVGWKWFGMRMETCWMRTEICWDMGWQKMGIIRETWSNISQTIYIYINISLSMTLYYRNEYSLIKLLLNFSFLLSTIFKMIFNYVYNSFCYKWAT